MADKTAPHRWGAQVTEVQHPLVKHKLTLMREASTTTAEFRRLMREMGMLLAYELTRDLELEPRTIQTPVATIEAPVLAGKKLCLAPILRAGMGLLEGMLELIPSARVAHIGLYRDPKTLTAVEYYFKVPEDLSERQVIVIDPMLATGNSAVAAVDRLLEHNAGGIRLACLLAAPEGLDRFTSCHPAVPVIAAAIDSHLNEHGYIVPGLGDAGDRLYGTK